MSGAGGNEPPDATAVALRGHESADTVARASVLIAPANGTATAAAPAAAQGDDIDMIE